LFVPEAINKHEKSGLSRRGRKAAGLKKRLFAGALKKRDPTGNSGSLFF
jgi:hypothetical protein